MLLVVKAGRRTGDIFGQSPRIRLVTCSLAVCSSLFSSVPCLADSAALFSWCLDDVEIRGLIRCFISRFDSSVYESRIHEEAGCLIYLLYLYTCFYTCFLASITCHHLRFVCLSMTGRFDNYVLMLHHLKRFWICLAGDFSFSLFIIFSNVQKEPWTGFSGSWLFSLSSVFQFHSAHHVEQRIW